MPPPIVTIVLPTHNGARYLGEAVRSCLDQTFRDWELILVDDASTDDTPSLIAGYAARDARIRAIRNPANRGLPASLNAGFEQARGELFTWTSDDNCYRPEALAEMVTFLQDNPAVDIVYAPYTLIDATGAATGSGRTGPPAELAADNVVGACFLYRRAVHEQLGGYDESMRLMEDYDFWLRAARRFRMAQIPKDLYQYRCHAGSLTASRAEEVAQAHERLLARHMPEKTWTSLTQEARKELSGLIPPGETFILVDEDKFAGELLPDRRSIPFLEEDGQYWGAPPDDPTALRELERLRRDGAHFMVFAWPAFWWLDYYLGLRRHLYDSYRRVWENDRLIVFDLRLPATPVPARAARSQWEQPNDAAGWEEIYAAPAAPVDRLASPVARAIADLTQPGDALLEAGCGSATVSAELATAGRVIELCDFSQPILDRAAELFRVSGLPAPRRTRCDLTRPLPFPDRAVDTVWSSGVLEHWTDEELVPIVRELARISRKSVISLVPNARCVFYRLAKHLAEEAGEWPYGREIPRRTLAPVFAAAGLAGIREDTVWQEWGAELLGLTELRVARLIDEWWSALPPDDPVKEGQGYLLLTIGYVDESEGASP